MYENTEEAEDIIRLAQSAADRHGVPFFIYAETLFPNGYKRLRLTSNPILGYLERFDPITAH